MQKKGQSHVDWVVSVGIFLIYILTVFVLIRPGYRPVYEGPMLLKIVDDNFKKDSYWSMTKMPLFISTKNVDTSCSRYDSVNDIYTGPLGNQYYIEVNFPFLERAENENSFFIKDSIKYLQSRVKATNCNVVDGTEICDYLLDLQAGNIVPGENEPYIYTIFFDATLPPKPKIIYDTDFKPVYECTVSASCSEITSEGNSCFIPTFGVSETLRGISENYIKPYQDQGTFIHLSKPTNYPEVKEFNITMYKDTTIIYSGATYTTPEPTNIDIYVKQYKDFILQKDGALSPVTVLIKVF